MRLHSVELKNYRRFGSFKVESQRGFNVIAGVSGSGKASLLKALTDALTGPTNYLSISTTIGPLTDADVARVETTIVEG